jgi:hypothetical protein
MTQEERTKLAASFRDTVRNTQESDTRFVLEIHGVDGSGRPVKPVRTELGNVTVRAAPGTRWSPNEKAHWQEFAHNSYIQCVFDNIYSLVENWDARVPYNNDGQSLWITDYKIIIERDEAGSHDEA